MKAAARAATTVAANDVVASMRRQEAAAFTLAQPTALASDASKAAVTATSMATAEIAGWRSAAVTRRGVAAAGSCRSGKATGATVWLAAKEPASAVTANAIRLARC